MKQPISVFSNGFYWVNFDGTTGSEQSGRRPAIVVRSTKESPICTVLPITTEKYEDTYPFHVDLVSIHSTVLVEQIRTIDKSRIDGVFMRKGEYVKITQDEWQQINRQLESLYRLKDLLF